MGRGGQTILLPFLSPSIPFSPVILDGLDDVSKVVKKDSVARYHFEFG
jgi:hypothetical protein